MIVLLAATLMQVGTPPVLATDTTGLPVALSHATKDAVDRTIAIASRIPRARIDGPVYLDSLSFQRVVAPTGLTSLATAVSTRGKPGSAAEAVVCNSTRSKCTIAEAGVLVELGAVETISDSVSVVIKVQYPTPTKTADTGMISFMEYRAVLHRGTNGSYGVVSLTPGRVS